MAQVLIRNHQRTVSISSHILASRMNLLVKAVGKEGQHISVVFTDAKTMRDFNKFVDNSPKSENV
jgi:ssRNA-specific RNase YbeY (16S rRNA maturation enzyme)